MDSVESDVGCLEVNAVFNGDEYTNWFLWVKWPNQQCQSTEGSSSPKDLASIPPSPSHHVTILQHTVYSDTQYTYIHKNESKHSEMGPV